MSGMASVHYTIRPSAAGTLAVATSSREWPSRRRWLARHGARWGKRLLWKRRRRSPPQRRSCPVLKVGYVRHAQAVCGGWPGHGFNNDTACNEYSQKLLALGKELGIEIDLADAHDHRRRGCRAVHQSRPRTEPRRPVDPAHGDLFLVGSGQSDLRSPASCPHSSSRRSAPASR